MNFQLLSSSPAPRMLRLLVAVLACVLMTIGASVAMAADQGPASSAHDQAAAHTAGGELEQGGGHAEHAEHHGVSPNAPVFEHRLLGFIPFNNSMIVTWFVAAGLIIFAQYATRRVKDVPDGAQNFWEFLVESLRNFLESIIGRHLTKTTFWFFATVFIFILFTNWFGLLPGIGTIGWGNYDHDGTFHVAQPLLRGANADLNMTLAMALIFFGCWIVWAFQANGPGGFFLHIFGPKGDTKGFMKVVMVIVFALVGLLEVVSIMFRPVSLSFRLFGNVFAGENMLESMSTIYPPLAGIIPIPFYFMEILVGLVQALVFMLLTAVFTLLICSHGEEPHSGQHH